jgi:hypothetical protein
MTVAENGNMTERELDLRVRDRLVASGELKPEALEVYLAGLPDMAFQAEGMGIDQPALGPAPHGSRIEPALDDGEGIE